MRALNAFLLIGSLGSLGACDAAVDPLPTAPPPSLAKAPSSPSYVTIGPTSGAFLYGLNEAGQVVGTLGETFGPTRAFIWTPASPRGTSGTLTDLGTLGGNTAGASAINNVSWVVGGGADAAQTVHPFVWTTIGGMKALDLPADVIRAMDMNDAGQVVGSAASGAVVWNVTVASDGSAQTSGVETLPALPSAGSTVPFGINEPGQAVGWSVLETNHAVMWTRTSTGWIVEDLGTPAGGYSAVARDANDAGLVVGYSTPRQGCPSAVVWTTQSGRKTGMRVLPTLGGCGAEAYGVNNQGDVVGRSANQRGYWRATAWRVAPDGSALSVTELGAPTPNANGLAHRVNSRINGVAQAVGALGVTNGTQTAIWTIR